MKNVTCHGNAELVLRMKLFPRPPEHGTVECQSAWSHSSDRKQHLHDTRALLEAEQSLLPPDNRVKLQHKTRLKSAPTLHLARSRTCQSLIDRGCSHRVWNYLHGGQVGQCMQRVLFEVAYTGIHAISRVVTSAGCFDDNHSSKERWT